MRSLLILCTLLSLLLFAPCSHAQSQREMNEQSAARLAKVDSELNRVYQAVLKEHAEDKEFLADLKEAQRTWLHFVEFHLKTAFPLKKGERPAEVYGSSYPTEFAEEKITLIEQRTAQLKSLSQSADSPAAR